MTESWTLLKSYLDDSPSIQHFYKLLYDSGFHPDINGYTLIYLLPPDLSGYFKKSPLTRIETDRAILSTPLLALDFSPPEIQVTSSNIESGASVILPYATGVNRHGQLSINFIDNSKLEIYKMHETWVNYMEEVIYGSTSPDDKYITTGMIDYATSAYVVKFKPNITDNKSSILHVGKAVGIFPANQPTKEIIGVRGTHEITMVPMNYTCSAYVTATMGQSNYTGWVIDELLTNITKWN
jgi:hypothetical protein